MWVWSTFFSMNMAALFSPRVTQSTLLSLLMMRMFSVVPRLNSSEISLAESNA